MENRSDYDRQLKQLRGPCGVSTMKRESCFQRGMAKASHTFQNVSVEQDQTADLIKISPFISMWQQLTTNFYCQQMEKKTRTVLYIFSFYIQLTLVISTPLISILSLTSNWFLSPDYFPYVFIVFQLRVCQTTFMSTLQLSRPSFSVPEYIFHSFYYRVSRTRTMTKEKKK